MKRRSLQVEKTEAGSALSSFLARTLKVSRAQAEHLVTLGAVYVDGRRCLEAKRVLRAGQKVTAVLEESGRGGLEPARPSLPLAVLYEDEELLAANKPPGLSAQPTPGRVGESLLDLVSAHLGRDAGLVHRLDRETSGVTVFAKTKAATSALAAQFREGAVRKRYLAATMPGLPERGTIELPIAKDPTRPGRQRALRHGNGKPAVTDFERLFADEVYCLVALFPRTGRTHQLRAHLRALDAPILGDALYGGPKGAGGLSAPRVLLHAQALVLAHPRTKAPVLLEAPVPHDLARFFTHAQVEPPHGAWR
ncbi:MAG: RluA family pseudouridine synthase [Myxococcota bacterium]